MLERHYKLANETKCDTIYIVHNIDNDMLVCVFANEAHAETTIALENHRAGRKALYLGGYKVLRAVPKEFYDSMSREPREFL